MRGRIAGILFAFATAGSTGAHGYFESYPGCHSRAFGATRSMVLAPNGDPIVTGCLHTGGPGYDTTLTMRYSGATGAVLWSAQLGNTYGNAGAAAIAVDGAGDVVVAGFSYDSAGRQNMQTIKYDGATGSQRWASAFVAQSSSRANAVAVNAAGDVFVTGESTDAVGGRNMRTVKYDGASGAQLWTASYNGSFAASFDIGQAVVADSSGGVFVTGLSGETVGGSNFRTIAYDAASGAQRWATQMGVSGDDSGLDAVIAQDGDLVVAGYTYEGASGSAYRVIKYGAATGDVRWTTAIPGTPAGGNTAESVGLDAAGNVFVTGFGDGGNYNMHTVKLDGGSGAVLWNVAYNGAANGDDLAVALAVDASGDVAVTGASQSTAFANEVRTIKYRGQDGHELWSVAYPGTSGLGIAADERGDILVAGSSYSLGGYGFQMLKYAGDSGSLVWTSDSPVAVIATASPGPVSGLWWSSAESGWGIDFTQRNDIVFAAWYTYDASGNPKWYVASRCVLPSAAPPGNCSDTLYEVNGPAFFPSTSFNSAMVHAVAAGTLRLDFADANTGSMTYSVAGQTRTVPIARQPLPVGVAPPPIDFTDLWWNPAESGWGLAITHRFDVMFLAWYVYDGAGRPVWLVASNCRVVSFSHDGCSGTLYRTTGPAFGPSFDPAQVHAAPAGTVAVSFTDPNNGVLTYTVDGTSGRKSITRQLF